jgi:hypothetical protein
MPPRDGLWVCPRCGRTFATANQTHTCAPLGDLDRHFAAAAPPVREAFDRIVEIARAFGPVEVLSEKTRIALHVRMSFAAFMPRTRWLDGHLVLPRRIDTARFRRIEVYSPRNVLHAFRLTSVADVDAEFVAWLAEAYAVGRQDHRAPPVADGREAQLATELLRVERALAERDRSAVPQGLDWLLDDPFLEFGASGRRWNRAETVAALAAEKPRALTFSAFAVRRLSAAMALVTYDLALRQPDGADRRSRRTSLWRLRDGRWVLRFHQGTAVA